jgi:hypothetical protein
MSILCTMVGATFSVAAAAEVIRAKKGIIAIANAQINTAQSKFGGSSMLTDGTADCLYSKDFDLTGDWTFEGWYRINSAVTETVLFRLHNSSDSFQANYGILNSKIYTFQGGTTAGSITLSTGTWYHLAYVRSGNTVNLYVDGTLDTSRPYSLNLANAILRFSGIGFDNYSLNGWSDEIRISNIARYTANFTPSTTPFVNDQNTLLLLHMDGTNASTVFEDDNGVRAKRSVIALNQTKVSTAQSQFGGASAEFDGNDDHLSINGLPSITGDFTFECWGRFDILPWNQTLGGGSYMMAYTGSSSDYLIINRSGSGSQVNFQIATGNRYGSFTKSGVNLAINTWYHIAIVRNSGVWKAFFNGTELTTFNNDSNFTNSGRTENIPLITIGRFIDARGSWDGYMDEIRVSNSARYTGDFTPSTAPFVNDANTLMLIHADGTNNSTYFEDDNGVLGSGEYNADPYASFLKLAVPFDSTADDVAYLITGTGLTTAATKTQGAASTIKGGSAFGGYANTLHNVRDAAALTYVIPGGIPTSASGTYVVEGWFAARDSSTNNNWVLSSADVNGRWLLGLNTGTTSQFAGENWVGIGTGWHHCAIVCDAGTKRFYVDGIYKGAFSTSNTGFTTLHVGQFTNNTINNFIGSIQDLRVYIGTNKGYTGTSTSAANFTLPQPIKNYRSKKSVIAVGNAQISTTQNKFGGSSALFDGTDDRLEIPYSTEWVGSAMTYEFWIRADNNASNPGIISFYSGDRAGFGVAWAEYDDTIKFLGSSNGITTPTARSTTGTVTKNVWNHVAFVVTGNEVTAYLNGVKGTTGPYIPVAVSTGTPLKIASGTGISTTWSGTNFLIGNLDEIRISNTVRYTDNFTPSTTPFVNDANTLLLLHMDGTNGSTVFTDDNGVAPDHNYS